MSQLPAFLDKCREAGWRVLGADAGRDAVPAGDVGGLPGSPAVLVLVSREVCDAIYLASHARHACRGGSQGNEGTGLRTMVKRSCDALVCAAPTRSRSTFPSSDAARRVDSLNVSVAAGILIADVAAQVERQPVGE